MKNLSLALNIVLLFLVGLLYYWHFSKSGNASKQSGYDKKGDSLSARPRSPIAYFQMDSVDANYEYIKQVRAVMKDKEDAMQRELKDMENGFQRRIAEYQKKGPTMSQIETQEAQKDMEAMNKQYMSRKAELEQDFLNMREKKMGEIFNTIRNFLKEYNKDNRYSYILNYEPQFMFYVDSAQNITSDVVRGLNAGYKKNP
jgi:outer membrane protein